MLRPASAAMAPWHRQAELRHTTHGCRVPCVVQFSLCGMGTNCRSSQRCWQRAIFAIVTTHKVYVPFAYSTKRADRLLPEGEGGVVVVGVFCGRRLSSTM